ncbi:hypothetical protein L3Y34_008124 [Caenorhabditis briggsae]|uniref:Uncharacterized protein n=1 Tax=Caenorhabditis briggsae TaxID=6238 RepID=A0AAE9A8L3_CAEBR|nr:hypothetical protein L3Y34_008124 [Caenorhabditis briggsae]
MIRSLILLTLLVGYSTSQYAQQQRSGTVQQQPVQNVQAAQPEAIDGIPAWYQMAKPVASRVQQLPQASPSYYERIEPTYEQRRGEQPTYERPGIQTNQYANYPSYQNRQPYENLNALTSGASLSNLQASRRYPSAASGGAGGSDPNTELLAAIKDVVAKFKASLDEAGIDQDVRLMGNQLKNTWQQLRTGLDRGVKAVRQSAESSVTHFNYGPQPLPQPQPVQIPYHHQHHHHPAVHRYTPGPMNEQIGRLFEKAVADAADQKTQQQIQQVQQQMIAPRP